MPWLPTAEPRARPPLPPQLKQLDISNNALTTLPPELSGCAKLKILKVAGNKLTSVHYDALFGAPTLQTIDLSGNALTAVPRLPPAAVTVDLSRNAISTVSAEALEPLSMLRELDLSNNQLESLPNLGGMARLGTLNLDDNVLVTLGDDWSGTPKLGVVFARRNRLTAASLPASLFRDTVLQRLELAGNRDMVKTELMVAEGFDAFLERRKARVDKALKADLDPSRDLCGLG